ncbi:MAG: hypothetical protein AAB250_14105 [Bdellovibrionota bacterium]
MVVRQSLRDLPKLLGTFARDPVGTMRSPLTLSWPAITSLVLGSAIVSGVLVGVLSRSLLDFLIGLLLFPLTSLLITIVFTFFIYYFFSLFKSTFLEFTRLASIVSLAMVPYFFVHTFSSFAPPIDLIGFALTGLLLIVGLVEQFGLDRKVCVKLIGGLGAGFFIIWSVVQFQSHAREKTEQERSPKTLEEMK